MAGTSNFNEVVSRQGALTCFCDSDKNTKPEAVYEVHTALDTIE